MVRTFMWFLAVVMVVVFGTTWAIAEGESKADAAAQGAAKTVIEKVTKDSVAILREKDSSKEQKREKIHAIADNTMDAEAMCKMSLARNWRSMSDAQKKDFITEFKKYVASTFSHTLDQYTDEDVNVTGTRAEAYGDVTVTSKIIGTLDSGARGEVAKVDYRLRKAGDAWKVIDLNIDGISLIANFRSQFQDIISNGDINKLLQTLKEKNASPQSK